MYEGCLSLGNLRGPVSRPKEIVYSGFDAYGNPINPHRSLGSSANLQIGALQLHLQALLSGGERTLSVASSPWAIASVNGVSRGKTPVSSIPFPDEGVRLELIRPGMDSAVVLKISPSNH